MAESCEESSLPRSITMRTARTRSLPDRNVHADETPDAETGSRLTNREAAMLPFWGWRGRRPSHGLRFLHPSSAFVGATLSWGMKFLPLKFLPFVKKSK